MKEESRALQLSAWMNLGWAALGIGFGLATESTAIMLDGYFSLVGFVMALVTLRVAKLVLQPPDEHFHFGYAQFEPFLNAVKGLLMLGVSGFALAAAVTALLHGGRDVNPGLAIVYALIAMAGCLLVGAVQRRTSRRTGSPILAVDAKNWLIDGAMSAVVALAFGAAWVLGRSPRADLVPFVDPLLVIVMVIAIAFVPLGILKESLREILAFAPDPAIQADVRARVEGSLGDLPVAMREIRMMKVGRFLYVLNQIVLSPEFRPGRIGELDRVRERIAAALEGVEPTPVVDTLFTEDRRWAE
ncbi:MAG: cation diffusion facilitator family transporter [marine benthic group bacterium]|nr:cation diffusion facilitator family transporter [Gemmatimonadota bacterium]MCL7981873.1 cation diffusion facilitator family transporter [Gemmatimonadota bacterium]MCL7984522.1 cation diffusion facilitator family transporter [Gemmatimonadota bacterium]MCL7990362.1 cation diffusion facilitator family transporter [Gemmatimonadota bacterium]